MREGRVVQRHKVVGPHIIQHGEYPRSTVLFLLLPSILQEELCTDQEARIVVALLFTGPSMKHHTSICVLLLRKDCYNDPTATSSTVEVPQNSTLSVHAYDSCSSSEMKRTFGLCDL